MIIGKKEFDTDRHTYIMGILNVTPDSFSDGGRFLHPDAALRHAEEMIRVLWPKLHFRPERTLSTISGD